MWSAGDAFQHDDRSCAVCGLENRGCGTRPVSGSDARTVSRRGQRFGNERQAARGRCGPLRPVVARLPGDNRCGLSGFRVPLRRVNKAAAVRPPLNVSPSTMPSSAAARSPSSGHGWGTVTFDRAQFTGADVRWVLSNRPRSGQPDPSRPADEGRARRVTDAAHPGPGRARPLGCSRSGETSDQPRCPAATSGTETASCGDAHL
jgi:hypothetical protein